MSTTMMTAWGTSRRRLLASMPQHPSMSFFSSIRSSAFFLSQSRGAKPLVRHHHASFFNTSQQFGLLQLRSGRNPSPFTSSSSTSAAAAATCGSPDAPTHVRGYATQVCDPLTKYRTLIEAGVIRDDAKQRTVIDRVLQPLYHSTIGYDPPMPNGGDSSSSQKKKKNSGWFRSLFGASGSKSAPTTSTSTPSTSSSAGGDFQKGLYMYGDVGCGKTFLMDLFYDCAQVRRKKRVHFHSFMLDVHRRIHAWRKSDTKNHADPIIAIAEALASESVLLCFDEFQVTDIADASILHRLFKELFANKVVVVCTSNREPSALYKNGLQRDLFLPFIDLLAHQNTIHNLDSNLDYRLTGTRGDRKVYFETIPTTTSTTTTTTGTTTTTTTTSGTTSSASAASATTTGAAASAAAAAAPTSSTIRGAVSMTGVTKAAKGLAGGIEEIMKSAAIMRGPEEMEALYRNLLHEETPEAKTIDVSGRLLTIPRSARGVARTSFEHLCETALGAADYIALSQEFHTLVLDGVPKMELQHKTQARRFIVLIDALYEHKVKFICSAEAPPSRLFDSGSIETKTSNDSGSSSSTDTNSNKNSSTDLAEDDAKIFDHHLFFDCNTSAFFSGDEEAFAFNRAVSRMIEMQSHQYLQSAHSTTSGARDSHVTSHGVSV